MLSITVNTPLDNFDPGNPTTDGLVSLREAILAANSDGVVGDADGSSSNAIVFDATEFESATEIELAYGQLSITDDVTIDGPGASLLTVDAQDSSRVFAISTGTNATISGLTVTGGSVTGTSDGGGIHVSGALRLEGVAVVGNDAGDVGGGIYVSNTGSLQLFDSTVDDNEATRGGGIFGHFNAGEILSIVGSTISNNTATGAGGGLNFEEWSNTTAAVGTIVNSTFSGNSAQYSGAVRVCYSQAELTIINSTITENVGTASEGGVSALGDASIVMHNTIVANNSAPSFSDLCRWSDGSFDGSAFNLIGSVGNSGLSDGVADNQVITGGVNPGVTALRDHGGPTKTHALLSDSPAIDQGSHTVVDTADLDTDQRGFSREVDDDNTTDGTDGYVDIGAFEYAAPIIVSTTNDEDDGNYGPGDLSLREAIDLAAAIPGDDTITFAEDIIGTIELGSGLVLGDDVDPIVGDITIEGPGADQLTLDANGATNLISFQYNSLAYDLTIHGLTLSGASGAALSRGSEASNVNLTLEQVEIADNGAGVDVSSGGSLTITDSTIAENSGRGLSVFDADAYICNSTISNNGDTGISALDGGYPMVLEVVNSTIACNGTDESADGSGLSLGDANLWVELHNTIVAENTDSSGARDIWGTVDYGTYNLIGSGGSGGLVDEDANGNLVLTAQESAGLADLGDYGGPTRTRALLVTSPAIDAGDNTVATQAGLSTDQRGFAWFDFPDVGASGGTPIDIGAYEAIPPVVDLNGPAAGDGYALTYTEGDGGVLIVDDEDATITDLDSDNLSQLTIAITDLQNPGAEFVYIDAGTATANGINADYSVAGQVTLTGTAGPCSKAAFINVLRTARYLNVADDPGTARTIEFVANDGRYDSSAVVTAVTVVPVNDAPTAEAGGPYAVQLNDATVLDGSGSTDPDHDTLTYDWDLNNDGVYTDLTDTMRPTISWSTLASYGIDSAGTYTIGLRVTDAESVVATDTATITVYEVGTTVELIWDPDGDETNGYGGSGEWTDFGVWYNPAIQDHVAWSSSLGGGKAVFSGTAGTVTVNGAVSAVGVDFTIDGYTISPDPDGMVILASNATDDGEINVSTGTATIATTLAGSVGLEKTGSGKLELTGVGTYCESFTYGTQVTAGTLQIGDGGTTGIGTIMLNSGTTLAVDRSDELTIANEIQGYGSLTKDGSGTLTLAGANTLYRGTVTVDEGELEVGNNYALTGRTTLVVGADATVDLHGLNTTVGYLYGDAGALITDQGGSGTTLLTVGGGALVGGGGDYSGIIADGSRSVALKVIAVALTLRGANAYTGGTTVWSRGYLTLGRPGGNTLATTGDLTMSTYAGILDLGGYTQEISGAVSFQGGTAQNGTILKSGADYDGQAGNIKATLSGDVGLKKSEYGTLMLEGAKEYSGETTISSGTLVIKNGFDLTGKGRIVISNGGFLQFINSQSITCSAGTGEILLQGDDWYDSFEHEGGILVGGWNEDIDGTTLTVGANVFIHGHGIIKQSYPCDELVNYGTIQADTANTELALETLSTSEDTFWTNEGTFAVVGSSILAEDGPFREYHYYSDPAWEGYFWGSSSVLSGTEVAVSWDGFTGGQWTYELQASVDADDDDVPDEYFTVATHNGAVDDVPSTFTLSGLEPGESYFVRIVGTYGNAKEIYDAGKLTTLDTAVDANVPDDTSGWYRVGAILSSGSYTYDPVHISNPPPVEEETFSTTLVPVTSSGWSPYCDMLDTDGPGWLADDATVFVSGAAGSLPLGSDHAFNLDTSWIYASSPASAVMQAVKGLVADGSTPTVVDGVVRLWRVRYYQELPSWHCSQDYYTFDLGRCPSGGYSEVWRCDPYDIPVEDGPSPCTDRCCPPPDTGSGDTSTNDVISKGGCSACGTAVGGLTYSSRLTWDSGYGPGWSDADEFPTLLGGSENFAVRFGTEAATWFDADGGSYTARYGALETLVHDDVNGLYIFTKTDGTQYEFYDAASDSEDPHPQYGLHQVVSPSGAIVRVTDWWADEGVDGVDGKIKTVEYMTSDAEHAYQKRDFTYSVAYTDWGEEDPWYPDDIPIARRVRVATITLSEYDGQNWTNVRKTTYDYYGDSESYGAAGDLKTVLTEQWNGSAWTGDDTYYYRYWTGEYDSTTNPGHAHDLQRVLLPNAYAAALAEFNVTSLDEIAENTQGINGKTIADFTCFYYEYDADHRVTDEVVFGASNESTFTNTLSDNADGYNSWYRKNVETKRGDGGAVLWTNTVYTNYIGQTLLTDLYDTHGTPSTADDTHTLTYNRYGTPTDGIDGNDGKLILTVDSAAFVSQGGDNPYYNDGLYADLINYAGGNSPYLSDSAGMFRITTYYESTAIDIDEDTDGGVTGYVYQEAVAEGETVARLTIGSIGGPDLLSSYKYYARTVVDNATIYPVASYTTYAGENGTGAATTTYAYAGWYTDSFQYQQLTTTLPVVAPDENGPAFGTPAVTTKQWYDIRGNLTWWMNELGRVTYYEYNSLTGQLTKTIEDIDAAEVTELSLTSPASWTLPTSDGVNAVTEYEYDALGRVTQTLGPAHLADVGDITLTNVRTATWTFYNDADHETRSAQGYVADETSPGSGVWTTFAIVGPISITITDRDGRTTEQIQADYTGSVSGLATATISQEDYTAWTTYQYSKTRMVSMRVYDDIPTTDGVLGTAGVNYEQTSYGYEDYGEPGVLMGRQNKVVAPDGTITRYVLDARGNTVETWMGLDDTGATDADPSDGDTNDMVKVASYTYDADGNLLTNTSYADGSTSYTTEYQYDWRNRRTDVLAPADVSTRQVTHYDYDNLGRTTWTKTYAMSGTTPLASELRAQTQNLYDSQGRVYTSYVYEVEQQDAANPGTVGDCLPTYYAYDAAGQLLITATGNGLFTKYAYDGLGRPVASYTCFDADESTYAEFDDVDGDTVVEQTLYWYDQASQVVATASYQRLPDDAVTTGALDASNSYATASVAWYDGLGRTVATVDYGREDVDSGLTHYFFDGTTGALKDTDSDGIPNEAEAAPPVPYTIQNPTSLAGIDFQLQLTAYNDAGWAYRSIDNLGRVDETQYDDAGRIIKTIQNYANGTVEEADTDQDVTVDYEYDSGGRLATMTAYNALDTGNGVQTQATRYLYTSDVNASWQTDVVYPDSADILSQNPTTKVWTFTTDNGDHVSTTYDRLGRKKTTTDQRGVEHTYLYDDAGRLSADTVTSFGSSGIVDGDILGIGTTYDDVGRVETVTSYSGLVANQVKYEYDGWGNVYREYQQRGGEVYEPLSPYVQYDYEDGASGYVAKYVRLSKVTYPDGRQVHYDYGTAGAIDDVMSRISAIYDDANDDGDIDAGEDVYVGYKYLGAGRIVTEDYKDIEVKLDYSAGDFAALDRFGRVLDQVWTDYGATPGTLDHISYTYDRAGNRTSRDNELHAAFDEDYTYDDLDRLLAASRYDDFDQAWTLDGLGNWAEFKEDDDDDATWDLDQNRATDEANQIESISGTWVQPRYDAAGNMIYGPKPGDETTGQHYIYDAWNRLVAVREDDGDGEYHPGAGDTLVGPVQI